MTKKRSHLNSKWYVVGPPWGDGVYIIAGHDDPHLGIFVTDCVSFASSWEERKAMIPDWDIASPQEVAQRIVADHNEMLRLLETRKAQITDEGT